MEIKIYDSHNKQWLETMAFYFGEDGKLEKVTAHIKNSDPLTDGFYKIEGEDLNKIAILGSINFNTHLFPKKNNA